VLAPVLPGVALGNGLEPAWISRDTEVVRAYQADPLVHDRITPRLARFFLDAGVGVQSAASRWSVPTLLQYAGADRCVRPEGSVRFAAAAPAGVVTVQPYPGLAHEIYNEPERAKPLADLDRWLDLHLH
jgi:alpha-beta hydrolase superfamily lysophospholipase